MTINSELYMVQDRVNENKIGEHYFRWHAKKFTLVHFELRCSSAVREEFATRESLSP